MESQTDRHMAEATKQQVFNRTGQEAPHPSQLYSNAGGPGGNVSASNPYTLKNDKHREDSTAVVQGKRVTGVTELSRPIRHN